MSAIKLRQARTGTRPGGATLMGLALLSVAAACEDSGVGPAPVPEYSCAGDAVTVEGRTIPAAPDGYAVVANQIVKVSTCAAHRFVGVSKPGLHYSSRDARMEGDTAAADFGRIKAWGANVVRITISQNYWVPTARWYDRAYPARVEEAVRRARATGLDVILALQTSDRGDPSYPGVSDLQQPMPDVNHSVPFWKDVASRFKNDGRVIFELFSEPYPSRGAPEPPNRDWDLWLRGGQVAAGQVYGEMRGAYQAVGMQRLYDEVRATGANNLVILGGLQWGYYLDGIPSHRVQGHNIAYAAHPWDWSLKQPDLWEKDWAFLARTDPVIISEFGDYRCNASGYTTRVLDFADQNRLSWVAWAWLAPSPTASDPQKSICEFPMLISDWSGTPSPSGQVVKQRLSTYK